MVAGAFPRHTSGYFLPASLMAMAGYWLARLWKAEVTHFYLMALPVVLVAIFLGRVTNGRLDGYLFLRRIHVGLVVIGAILMYQALV